MKTISYGRVSTLALLTAAMALGAQAQAQTQTAAPAAKAAAAPVAARATGPSETPPPAAPTVAKPAGSTEAAVTVVARQTAPAKKPGQEGVAMHGHWIIDLRNPDGTIAEHRDFENALLAPTFLFYLVTGQYSAGDLGITIASTGTAVCANVAAASTNLGSCLVAASSTAGLGGNTCAGTATGYCNYNLKEATNVSSGAITLSGTMPVLGSGAVTEVGTQIFACNSGGVGTYSTVDPVGCYNGTEGGGFTYGNLTGTTIPTLNVTAGQTISFTVVLTFS